MTDKTSEEEKLKELITEARQAIKDLKYEKKELEKTRAELDDYINRKIYEIIDDRIGEHVIAGLALLQKQIDKSEKAIHNRFDRIEEGMLGGKKKPAVEDLLQVNEVLKYIARKEIMNLGKKSLDSE